METRPGKAYPLGATFDGTGTNFAIYSSVATSVTLCLLDDELNEMRIPMTEVDAYVWHVYVPQVRAGQRYGYRIEGPWDPTRGLRCDPSKLLLDPYAKAIEGQLKDSLDLLSYQADDPLSLKGGDSAKATMHSVVVNPFFDWEGDRSPGHDYSESIIYEAHVKGMTMRHPDVPEELRGTYAGMAHPAIIEHLTKLGVTTVELMPIHQFTNDTTLQAKGLSNYWGYNTIGYFAPHNAYAATKEPGAQVSEFKAMVKALHAANIEVILDVVYNHTAEGNHMGPTLSFRGIDNPSYYRLVDGDRQHYFDTTGTGNSLLMSSPQVLQLIMDSLRYWVTEMHVDGFRFDLASTLARQFAEVDRLSAFFDLIHQDPVVSQVKLIAEPWDVGADLVPRHGARLLARRILLAARFCLPPRRLLGPVRHHGTQAHGVHQLRDRTRRLHAARPRVLQREAQRGEPRRRRGRRERQPFVELRSRGRHGRRGDHRAALPPAA